MKTITQLALALLVAGLCATSAHAQRFTTALHIGMTNGVLDEFGQPLKGVTPGAEEFGFTPAQGELVQILSTTNGIFPPDVDGNPDPRNTVIWETAIGLGLDPSEGPRSRFAASVPPRPGPGTSVFVRVFNKSTLPASSFYGDSEIFPVDSQFNYTFVPNILQTSIPTDTNDPDHDGLINSWEKSYGSNPNNPDTDGDGMPDGPEIRAGTGVTDENSLLQMVELIPAPPHNLNVIWDSVVGKNYQVEFKDGDLTDTNTSFAAVSGVILASGLSSQTTITNALNYPGGHYRVKLVEP